MQILLIDFYWFHVFFVCLFFDVSSLSFYFLRMLMLCFKIKNKMSHWPKITGYRLQVCLQGLFPEFHHFWAILTLTNFRTISDRICQSVLLPMCSFSFRVFRCNFDVSIFTTLKRQNLPLQIRLKHFILRLLCFCVSTVIRFQQNQISYNFSILIHTLW